MLDTDAYMIHVTNIEFPSMNLTLADIITQHAMAPPPSFKSG